MKQMTSPKPDKSDLNWVAAQIRPNMLKKACKNLENQAFEYFSPCRIETVKSGNRFRRVEKLLFPGYIFVRYDIHSRDISTLNATMGLSRLVRGLGNGPGIIPDSFVDALMVACDQWSLFKDKVSAGNQVRFVDGPFVGMVGEVISADVNGRLRILFDLIAGARTLTVDKNSVEIVPGQTKGQAARTI